MTNRCYTLFGSCKRDIFTRDVIHTGPDFPCLDIAAGVKLNVILEKIEEYICTSENLSIGEIGSIPNENGMTFINNVLNLEPASPTAGGVVTAAAQSFGGAKTFQELIINSSDQGDYVLTLQGGVYFNIMSKDFSLVGATTDNTALQVLALDASNNVVLRTVESIAGGGGGTSGTSGANGTSGVNGTSGISGTSGTSGTTGTSGTSGATGTSGAAGTSGTSGSSSTVQQTTFSGDGIDTSFQIPHGLVGTPKVVIQPANQDSAGYSYITVDATNITVNYNIAPPFGVNNIIINWIANL